MKITHKQLKKIIKEELQEMMGETIKVQSVTQSGSDKKVVLVVNGKKVTMSFSAAGGSPLVSSEYYELLSPEEREDVYDKAMEAAGIA